MASACVEYREHRIVIYVLLLMVVCLKEAAKAAGSSCVVSGKLWKYLSQRARSTLSLACRPAQIPMILSQNDSDLGIGMGPEVAVEVLLFREWEAILRDVDCRRDKSDDCVCYSVLITL